MEDKRKPQLLVSFANGNFQSVVGYPNKMHSSVLPLILIKDEKFKFIGSCFVVNPEVALAITARHIIDEAYSGLDLGPRKIEDSEGVLHAFYFVEREGQYFADVVPVQQVYLGVFDLAVIRTRIPVLRGAKPDGSFFRHFGLSFALPEVGEKCLALGYNKESTWRNIADGVEVAADLKASQGVVEAFLPFGYHPARYLNYPCFRMATRCDPGMSGGPVISSKSGKVCGVVSRGFEFSQTDEQRPLSHASHTTGLFSLKVPKDFSQVDGPCWTFKELVENRHIEADESFGELKFEKSGDGYVLNVGNRLALKF